MSKRSRTILTVSVRFPVPAGKSQKWALEELKKIVSNNTSEMVIHEATLVLERKEIVYL